jgi:hypothetical protein
VLQNIPKVCKVTQVMTLGPTPTVARARAHHWANDCVTRVLPFWRESHGWYLSDVAMVRTGKSLSNPRGNAHSPVLRVFAIAEDDPKYGERSGNERCRIELRDSVIRNIAPATFKARTYSGNPEVINRCGI